jgi:shikimate dehydrogenase
LTTSSGSPAHGQTTVVSSATPDSRLATANRPEPSSAPDLDAAPASADAVLPQIPAPPALYAVIGNPIGHSKSPRIHAAFAAQTGQRMTYDALLAPVDAFVATVRDLITGGGRGANVTVPFKLEAFDLADHLSERARFAGAVNTLSFREDGIHGDNTDGVGLVTDIVDNAGFPLAGKRILLLGAGGAARGVLLPLLARAPAELVIANRTEEKAAQLVANLPPAAAGGMARASSFADLRGRFDLIVNATSASLDAAVPPLPPEVYGAGTLAYDMMYGARPTVFMAHAAGLGATTRDGLGMLVEQAAESFFIWRGVRPRTDAVFGLLRGLA